MGKSPEAVFLTGKHRSDQIPHTKVVSGGDVYFVATLPEGDHVVHRWNARDTDGYGGAVVKFMMSDGSIETAKGPFNVSGYHDGKALIDRLFPDAPKLYKITVGSNLSYYQTKSRSVAFEDGFSAVPVIDRLRQEWEGFDLYIEDRHGTIRCTTVAKYLKEHG